MSLAENKKRVERFINEVMNAGNMDVINELCVPGSMFAGGIVGQFMSMKTAFPDIHFTIDEMIAEGDKVAVQVSVQGTNNGPLVGLPAFGKLETPVPPTGKSVSHTGLYLFTVVEGRIQSYAAELDQIGLLRQLGWSFTPPTEWRV
jgi:predicted ester cyclase